MNSKKFNPTFGDFPYPPSNHFIGEYFDEIQNRIEWNRIERWINWVLGGESCKLSNMLLIVLAPVTYCLTVAKLNFEVIEEKRGGGYKNMVIVIKEIKCRFQIYNEQTKCI